jgi:PAS domain S-box-containing protein
LRAIEEAVRPRAFPATPFDHITRVIATVLRVPTALVSLVDDSRQFFVGATGLPPELVECRETPLSQSICQYVVTGGEALRIVDAREHSLVRTSGAVTELGIVGYLGVPLRTSDGSVLGSLCALTVEPREWTAQDEALLRDLAVSVVSDLELRAELSHREDRARAIATSGTEELAEGLPARSVEILDSISDGVIALDRDWRVTFLNRRATRLLRTPRRKAQGELLSTLVPALRDSSVEQLLLEAVRSGQSMRAVLYWSGGERWFDVRAVPMRHGMTVYFDDVTERRQAREHRAQREEQLRQVEKMDAVTALAGGIAHDFNNMLTVVRANCELLLDAAASADRSTVELREIRSAAVRGSALTQQLLAFSRKQVVQPRVLDVNAAVHSVVPLLRRLIAAPVRLEAELDDAPLHVYADPTQLEQVLTNLALNARDAMPEGGTVRIRTSSLRVDHTTATAMGSLTPGEWVRISVQDSGEGIDAEVLPRIFEPFFTTKPIGGGAGLGLATVFAIARQLGGVLTVTSAVGEGTDFHLFLPLVAMPVPTAATNASDDEQPDHDDECILVVDDEVAVRRVVDRLLRASGYRPLLAQNGDDALDVMRQRGREVSLVLSDVMMPKMGGVSLAAALREQYPEVPVMLMSGFGETDSVQQQLARHDVTFVQKPFSARELLTQVRSSLARRAASGTS